jgi:hypothetical protein
MAALDLSTIPSDINTYERLHVWSGMCLQSIANGQQTNVVANGASQPTAQVQVGVTADNETRFIVTSYVPYDLGELNSSENKTWMAAEDISEAQPNANLLAN